MILCLFLEALRLVVISPFKWIRNSKYAITYFGSEENLCKKRTLSKKYNTPCKHLAKYTKFTGRCLLC